MNFIRAFIILNFLIAFTVFGFDRFVIAEDEQSLKVGVILPLSGFVADYGVAVKNAILLAQSEKSEVERKKIEFFYEDSAYDSKNAITNFNKLLYKDKVSLTYVWGTGPAVALAPIAESKKEVLLTLSGEPTVAANRNYVIDSFNRLDELSMALLKEFRKRGFKRIGILKSDVQYFESIFVGLKSNLNSDESIDLIDTIQPDDIINISGSILKIKKAVSKSKYDAIGVFLVTGQVEYFYKKILQYDIQIKTFGTDVFLNKDEMKKAGSASVGAFFATLSTTEDFSKKYIEKYGNESQLPNAANAYDMVNVLYEVFKDSNVNDLTSEKILNHLENAKPYYGAAGKFYFVNEKELSLPLPGKRFKSDTVIKEVIEGGGSVEVKE